MMYKRDIGNKIYQQMMQHFYCENGFLQEEIIGTRDYNLQQTYQYKVCVDLFKILLRIFALFFLQELSEAFSAQQNFTARKAS